MFFGLINFFAFTPILTMMHHALHTLNAPTNWLLKFRKKRLEKKYLDS